MGKYFQVINSIHYVGYDIYVIHARTGISVGLFDFDNIASVWYFQDTCDEYLLFASGEADKSVPVSVSSKPMKMVIDLYNDCEGI